MFRIKFPTKRIFRIFPILRTVGMAPFWNLFMERPSYKNLQSKHSNFSKCDKEKRETNRTKYTNNTQHQYTHNSIQNNS